MFIIDASHGFPNNAIALESTSISNLPDHITFLHTSLMALHITKHIPNRRRRGISKSIQSSFAWFDQLRSQFQLLFNFFDDSTSTWMDAEMIESLFEVWNISVDSPTETSSSQNEIEEEFNLFINRQHQWS